MLAVPEWQRKVRAYQNSVLAFLFTAVKDKDTGFYIKTARELNDGESKDYANGIQSKVAPIMRDRGKFGR